MASQIERNDDKRRTDSLQIFYLFVSKGHQGERWGVERTAAIDVLALRSPGYVMFSLSITQVIHPLYARGVLLIPEEQWWIVFIPLLLATMVVSIPVGKLIDKAGRKASSVSGLLIGCVGIHLFITGNLMTVMIAMSIFRIAQLMTMDASTVLLADLVQPENRGKVNDFVNFISYTVMGIGTLLGNYLYISFIPQLPYYVMLGLIVLAIFMVLLLILEPRKN